MLLEGKVAVVSGIGPGMGRDIALALAKEGADVVLGARTEAKLEAVAEEIRALGRRALPVPNNIADPDSCLAMAEAAKAEFGHVDILVNNAFHGGDDTPMLDAQMKRWHTTMEVNFFGALYMVRAFVPLMEGTGDGRIVMVNTMSTEKIEAKAGAYAASKAALKSVTKTLARELGPQGIRVNGIHPGYIWGESVQWLFNWMAEQEGKTPQEIYDRVAAETSLGYIPTSEEIAGTVVFFASPLAKAVTGQNIGVNAGHWFN